MPTHHALQQVEAQTDSTPAHAHEREAEQRWGHTAQWHEARMRTRGMGQSDVAQVKARWAALTETMGAHLLAGRAVHDAEVRATTAAWVDHLRQFYTPTPELVAGLGDLYVDDPQFAATFAAVAPGLPGYLRDALGWYAVEVMAQEAAK